MSFLLSILRCRRGRRPRRHGQRATPPASARPAPSAAASAAPSATPSASTELGSVLVIVLVALMFAAVALVSFIEKASNDLLMETREADAARLRQEAQSAMETVFAVLEDFRIVNNGLRSPAEGWSDPLKFAGYVPAEGSVVEVSFEDESGKLSLPTLDGPTLIALFKSWEIRESDAERLADALLGWMRPDHVPATAGAPTADDYDRGETPYKPPARSLRSFSELAAIKVADEIFYDERGRPNALWRRFRDAVSLYQYTTPNLNAAPADALVALSQFDSGQQQRFDEYRRGTGPYERRGPGFFKSPEDAAAIAGGQVALTGFGVEIRALRVTVAVKKGASRYELAVVVAPPGGAQIVRSGPTTPSGAKPEPGAPPVAPKAPQAGAGNPAVEGDGGAKKLNYPFTLLEITENVVLSAQHTPEPAL